MTDPLEDLIRLLTTHRQLGHDTETLAGALIAERDALKEEVEALKADNRKLEATVLDLRRRLVLASSSHHLEI